MPLPGNDGGTILRARASHLYPGATGQVEGRLGAGPCLVEFSDGSAAFGEFAPDGDAGGTLRLGAYSTARGTRVPPRAWRLAVGSDGAFRVAGRG